MGPHRGLKIDAVHLERRVAAGQLELDPRWRSLEGHRAHEVVVNEQLALDLARDAPLAGRRCEPARQKRLPDPVRHELRGQVVVVAARVIRGPSQSQVAVVGTARDDERPEILLRITGVDADAARLVLSRKRSHGDEPEKDEDRRDHTPERHHPSSCPVVTPQTAWIPGGGRVRHHRRGAGRCASPHAGILPK